MNDIIATETPLNAEQIDALMAKLHAADEAGVGEAASEEGEVIFVTEDSASQPSGTIH